VTFSSDVNRPGAAVSDTFVVTVNGVNDSPLISNVQDVLVAEDVATGPIAITIGDVETAAATLNLNATSSNQTLVPNAALLFSGTGAARTLSIAPAPNQSGTSMITLTVSDGVATAVDTFVLSVSAVNDVPTISPVADQAVAAGTAAIGPLAFTVGDVETQAGSLSVAATPSNQSVVAASGIAISGAGANRTLQLMLVPGGTGSSLITVTVSDGTALAMTTFTVTVAEPPPPPPPPAPEPPTPPAPPRNIVVEAPDGRTIIVRWDGPSNLQAESGDAIVAGVTGYQVELGSSTGASDAGVFTTGVTTSFTIANLAAGRYFVRVRATSEAGLSQPSSEVAITLDGSNFSPRSPRSLRATVNGATVQLAWDAPADRSGLTGYVVEAGSGGTLANYGTAFVASEAFTISALPRATYFLRVRAIHASGPSAPSNELVVIVGGTTTPCVPPLPPRGLIGGAIGTSIQLAWAPPLAGDAPTQYLVHAGSTAGATDLGIVSIDGRTTSAAGSAPAGIYFMRVLAVNPCGISEPSNELAITVGEPPALPGRPENLAGQVVGPRVTLTWTPPAGGGPVTRYVIEVVDPSGNPLISFDTGNQALSFTHGGVPPGSYIVRVRAANAAGIGPGSLPVTVVVP
jgi:hypothetical protein